MGEMRKAYNILVGNPDGNRPLGRPRCRCKDNISTDIREIGWEGVYWMRLAQDRYKWQTLVKRVMNFLVEIRRMKLSLCSP
jgi:hypothetical protein